MDDDMRIRYLFVELGYRTYMRVQIVVVSAWAVAAVLFYVFGRGSEVWLWDNAWWICILVAALEVFESRMAIGRARKALGESGDSWTA